MLCSHHSHSSKPSISVSSFIKLPSILLEICSGLYQQLLLCSHSPNDVFPEPQRNISIATVRGAMHPSKLYQHCVVLCSHHSHSSKPSISVSSFIKLPSILLEICSGLYQQLLLCSHSPNDVLPEPQQNVSIATVRGAMHPSKLYQHCCCVVFPPPPPPTPQPQRNVSIATVRGTVHPSSIQLKNIKI